MTVPAARSQSDTVEALVARGDLTGLTSDQRVIYYNKLCQSLGLNPMTKPFEYLTLNGKLVLYARRDAADQLRKIHGISLEIVSQETRDELLTIHVKAVDKTGRSDEDLGVVPFPPALKGEARSNAVMKAITKAKRRVTLSISGLGFLDESEVDSIPGAARRPAPPAPNPMLPPHDPETGEVIDPGSSPASPQDRATTTAPSDTPHNKDGAVSMPLEDEAREAASRGRATFAVLWQRLSHEERKSLAPIMTELGEMTREADALTREAGSP